MTIHSFECELWLPLPRHTIFPFFANAQNLQILTPPWLNFEILTPSPIPMQVGTLIDYRLRIHGIPVRWQSEITVWNAPLGFEDEQRRGPYRLWRHTHAFLEKNGGTLCTDRVKYAVLGGALVNRFFVRKDIQTIFNYRAEALKKHFAAGS